MAEQSVSIFGTFMIRAIALWSIVNGFFIILGGDKAWMNPVYDAVRFIPYSPESWGIFLMAGGALIFFGSLLATESLKIEKLNSYAYKIRNVGLSLSGVWCILFAFGLWSSHFISEVDLNFSPGTAQFLIAFLCAMALFSKEPRLLPNVKEK